MPSATQIYNTGKWLNAADLVNNPAIGLNKRITAVIHHVEPGIIGQDQKTQLICDLVSRQGQPWPKKLTLNNTRNLALVAAYGDDYSQWSGKPIEIWAAMVPFAGKLVPGIHVAAASNGAASAQPPQTQTAAPASYPPMPPAASVQTAPPSATAVAGLAPVVGGRPVSSIPSSPPIEDDEIPF